MAVILLLSFTNFYQFSFAYLTGENLLQRSNQIITNNQILITNNSSVTTLSGRTTGIWPEAWGLFLSSPLIGKGFHADRLFLNGQHTHNSLLHALVQSGFIGTLFFVSAFIYSWVILINIFKKHPQNIVLVEAIGILTFFTLRGITESTAFFGADFLFLIPVFAYLQFFPKDKQTNKQLNFLGNKIDIIKTSDAVEKISNWIKLKSENAHWIVVTGMHGIVEAYKNIEFKKNISSADLFVPDGISLVWLAKSKGFNVKKRVSGADLMSEFFRVANKEGFSSYFYGDTEETLEALKIKLTNEFPKLKFAGMYSPPFRELTTEEDEEIVKMINDAHPDVLWVGLGLPKQENWIYKHKERLNVSVVIGVGAAFKFLSGKVKRAPKLVGDLGFEWLWRLILEPKVVWKRIFLDGPIFFWLLVKDFLGSSKK